MPESSWRRESVDQNDISYQHRSKLTTDYNQHIQSHFLFKHDPLEDKLANYSSFVTVMKEAAQTHFEAKSSRQNCEYLSGLKWQFIQSRQEARLRRDYQTENLLNREIKKHARKDKMTWGTSKLADLTGTKTAWKQIRFEKQIITPSA